MLQVPRVCERAAVAARTATPHTTAIIRIKPPRTREGDRQREKGGRDGAHLMLACDDGGGCSCCDEACIGGGRMLEAGGQGRAADLGPAGLLGARVLPGDRSAPTTTSAAARGIERRGGEI